MLRNPGILVLLLLAALIAVVTVLAAWVIADATGGELVALFLVVVAAVFTILQFAYDRFVGRELRSLGDRLRSELGDRQPATLAELSEAADAVIRKKQVEIDRLKNLEGMRKEFIADVSHELKTPIFAAQGFVHTLLDGAAEEKSVRKKFLKKAAKSLDGLDMLVQDLLMLSQIESGQIKMRFRQFDLYDLTEEVFEQFRGKVNKKDIVLRIEGPQSKVTVYGDESRIGQVMTNLISNAIKHSAEGGEVVVSFTPKGKSLVTEVRDFGEGIPPEHIHRVFERFYRVDKSRSREKGGTGLGLAIVKHILDGHGTSAVIESELGRGTAVQFTLPREKKEG